MLFVMFTDTPPGPDTHTISSLLAALAKTRTLVSYAEILDVLGLHGMEMTAEDVAEVAKNMGFHVIEDAGLETESPVVQAFDAGRDLLGFLRGTRRQRRRNRHTRRDGDAVPGSDVTENGLPF